MSEDFTLVEQARQGDSDAFGELVLRHDAMVRGIIRRSGGASPSDEDDLSQSAFLTAYEKLKNLDDARRFEQWLWGITSRLCWRWAERERRRNHLDLDAVSAPQAHADGLSSGERLEIRNRVADAIVRLPPHQQSTVILRFLDGLTQAEIGEVLGLTSGQVRGSLYRGTRSCASGSGTSGTSSRASGPRPSCPRRSRSCSTTRRPP